MKAIEIKNLTKKYKTLVAVDNITLNIEEKEIFSLLGVNGAGKTTTIKMLSGLLKPTSGEAFIFGLSILTDMKKLKKIINVSPQETAIAPNLSVKENLEFISEIYGYNKKQSIKKTNDLIKMFDLETKQNDKASTLSGGMQRKLSIAMALISDPKILFLDEPTLGLDVISRRELWDIINSIKSKTTIILTTHYMEEAEYLSDRLAIMKNGRILDISTPEELMKKTNTKTLEDAFVKLVRGEK